MVIDRLDGRPLRREAGTVSPARHACDFCVELQRVAIRGRDLVLVEAAIRLREQHAANDAERAAFARPGCVERGGCAGSIRPTANQALTGTASERQNRPVVTHPGGR